MLSPGISGDNPNFSLAMWGDNSQVNPGMWNNNQNTGYYPGFSDTAMGVMPSAPAAAGVPQVDLLGGGATAYAGGIQPVQGPIPGSHMPPVGSGRPSMGFAPPRSTGGAAPMPDNDLERWLVDNHLNAQTLATLKQHSIDSLEVLKSLHAEDLPTLQLPLGQRRRLEDALYQAFHKDPAQPVSAPAQTVTVGFSQQVHPPAQPENVRATPGYAMHLDRPSGGKPDYLSILDHLPGSVGMYREAKVAGGDGQPELFMRTGYQKKLSKVTTTEWNCANTVIMDKLLRNGTLGPKGIREYLNYTFIVNELASRFSWESILKYDDEYRQLQAIHGFAWGQQVDHLSKVFLREKEPPIPSVTARGGTAGKPSKANATQACGLYNAEGKTCHYTYCKFAHACAICGKDHPRYEHGKPSDKAGKAKEALNQ